MRVAISPRQGTSRGVRVLVAVLLGLSALGVVSVSGAGPGTPSGEPAIAAPPAPIGPVVLIPSTRVVDTRATGPGIVTTGFDGTTGAPITPGPIQSNTTRRFLINGKTFPQGPDTFAFPSDLRGVLANVTIVSGGGGGGYVTVFPGFIADGDRPLSSTLNPITAIAFDSTAVAVALTGTAPSVGTIAVYSTNTLDLIIDVFGYYTAPSQNPGSAGWSLTGNAGTDPNVNFVGTTDNQPLIVKANGRNAIRISPSGGEASGATPRPGVAIGTDAGFGTFTVRVGYDGDGVNLVGSSSTVQSPGFKLHDVDGGANGLKGFFGLAEGPNAWQTGSATGDTVLAAVTNRLWLIGKTGVIIPNSNLGIGTASPTNPLHVVQTAGNTFASQIQTAGLAAGTSYGLLLNAGTSPQDAALVVRNQAGTDAMTVRGDGLTGIGTTQLDATADYTSTLTIVSNVDPSCMISPCPPPRPNPFGVAISAAATAPRGVGLLAKGGSLGGTGVTATGETAVRATGGNGEGDYGVKATGGIGVAGGGTIVGVTGSDFGNQAGVTIGVEGISTSSTGVQGESTNWIGVRAISHSNVQALETINFGTGDLVIGWSGPQSGAGPTKKFRVDNTGKGFFNGGTQTGGADVAEIIATTDAPMPGDVVEIDPVQPDLFRRSAVPNSTAVAGVISTKPGVTLNSDDAANASAETDPQLALVGRVPVKVSAENGAIHPGDLLVSSSTPGHAMRAPANPAPGTVVGKALGNLDDGTGSITMLVMLR